MVEDTLSATMTGQLVLGLFLAVSTAHAATFYCDPIHGSPEGDGSRARPWRTIENVLQDRLIEFRDRAGNPANPEAPVKPGDTVLLRSGWHGVIRVAGGYNDQFITIAADQGHAPQVGWIELGEGRKWRLRGLTVSPSLAPSPLESLKPQTHSGQVKLQPSSPAGFKDSTQRGAGEVRKEDSAASTENEIGVGLRRASLGLCSRTPLAS